MSDGCADQFWSYGSYSSALLLRDSCDLETVMFSRYAASEGKNLSDAIGANLKTMTRNNILRNKDPNSIEQINIESGGNLDDLGFNCYDDFLAWLERIVSDRSNQGFSSYASFDIINVDNNDIKQLIREDSVKKVKDLKKYHCFFADKDSKSNTEVLFRYATCACEICMTGNYRDCKNDKIFGKWKKHDTKKNYTTRLVKHKNHDHNEEDTEYEDCESEYEDLNEIHCDIEQITDTHIDNFLQENNIFIIGLETKQYLSKLNDINGKTLTFRFYSRDFN